MLKRIREKHKDVKTSLADSESLPLKTLKKLKIAYIPYNELLKEGFMAGLGWAFGVTIGFVVISTLLVVVFKSLGGLPIIGNFIADIVQETQVQLIKRTPAFIQN